MESLRKYSLIACVTFLLLANFFIWNIVRSSDSSELRVYFLDVGQGDAIFIKSPSGNKMLIDAGASTAALNELSKILPFNEKKIEVILQTHPDKDHVGGFIPILDRFAVDFIIESGVKADTRVFNDLEILSENSSAKRIIAQRGMLVNLGEGVVLLILFPDRDVSGLNSNDASIVAKLYYGRTTFVLTGDSPIKIEDYLVSLDGNILKSDVLKVGHHGSKTSTSETFVEMVNPQYAVIQAGAGNSYGHPHEEVLEFLKNSKAEILGTYNLGTILIKSDGRELEIESQ